MNSKKKIFFRSSDNHSTYELRVPSSLLPSLPQTPHGTRAHTLRNIHQKVKMFCDYFRCCSDSLLRNLSQCWCRHRGFPSCGTHLFPFFFLFSFFCFSCSTFFWFPFHICFLLPLIWLKWSKHSTTSNSCSMANAQFTVETNRVWVLTTEYMWHNENMTNTQARTGTHTSRRRAFEQIYKSNDAPREFINLKMNKRWNAEW